jgi:hypothetical protein
MKLRFFILLFFPALLVAQDTLIFRSGEKKTGTIKEISGIEVKYAKSADGPVYIVYKDELAVIKYASGKTDSLYTTNKGQSPKVYADLPKIKMEGNYLYCKGRTVDDFELKRLIDDYPYPETKESMLLKYAQMEKYRKKQHRAKTLIPIGCAFPVLGLVSSFVLFFTQPFDSDLPDIAFVTGAGLGVVTAANGIVFSIRNKKKKNNEKFDISILYNQMR